MLSIREVSVSLGIVKVQPVKKNSSSLECNFHCFFAWHGIHLESSSQTTSDSLVTFKDYRTIEIVLTARDKS